MPTADTTHLRHSAVHQTLLTRHWLDLADNPWLGPLERVAYAEAAQHLMAAADVLEDAAAQIDGEPKLPLPDRGMRVGGAVHHA